MPLYIAHLLSVFLVLLKKLFFFLVRYDEYPRLRNGPCLLGLAVNSRWRVGIMKPMELATEGKEVLAACVKHSQSGDARFGAKGSKSRVLVPQCDMGQL